MTRDDLLGILIRHRRRHGVRDHRAHCMCTWRGASHYEHLVLAEALEEVAA